MKAFTACIILFCIVVSCKHSSVKNTAYLTTRRIDTDAYPQLKKQFKIRDIIKASDYLGGLNPNYQIAIADQECNNGKDTDWMVGGFICTLPKIVVKKANKYILINNRQELKKLYAPITSPEEALGYAVLYTRFFAVFDVKFFKKGYKYYGNKPAISDVKQQGEGYYVHLFSYKQFGCEHPFYSIIVKVDKNGSVFILSQKVAFIDPKSNGICVD